MYGVIVCPRCKRAKGVDLKQKTTTCACGFEIRIAPSRVRARADTARELASLVGQVSAELAGQRAREDPTVDVVIDKQAKAGRGGHGKGRVDVGDARKDEREQERAVSEANCNGAQEIAPHLAPRGAEPDEGASVCVDEPETDRIKDEQGEGLRDVQDIAGGPRSRDDSARGDAGSQRDAVEGRVEAPLVPSTVQPDELEP